MKRVTAAALAAFSLLTFTVSARTEASARGQAKAPADIRPVSGEWRSGEQFDNQARATLVVKDGAGSLTGTLTLLGMTRGDDDRATVRVPFRDGAWDGTTLSFETVLPDGEGKARWTLRLTAAGKATLGPVTDDGKPISDGPKWEMSRH
jgi:hypothetical protein